MRRDFLLRRIFAAVSQLKPQSPANSAEAIDQHVDGARASIGNESLVQLVADGIQRGDREAESNLSRKKFCVCFPAQGAQNQQSENEILAHVP